MEIEEDSDLEVAEEQKVYEHAHRLHQVDPVLMCVCRLGVARTAALERSPRMGAPWP